MQNESTPKEFRFLDERFADLQMLRYQLPEFEQLTLQQKIYIYCLSKATLYGRDITFDQRGKYNLLVRKCMEVIWLLGKRTASEESEWEEFEIYLKRLWFSSGIYHHYGCEKFVPGFSEDFFCKQVDALPASSLPLPKETLLEMLCPVIFSPEVLPCRVNQQDGYDLVLTSACNFYEDVTQAEVEAFYTEKKKSATENAVSWGLNSKVVKHENRLYEEVWRIGGLYGRALEKITYWLERAATYAENESQKNVIELLVHYYRTGDLHIFDEYSIQWVKQLDGRIDFINGFIEVYGDPLGLKGTWEGIVEYKDETATRRTRIICNNAQWFEDHSPVDGRFKKKKVKGVTACVVNAAMLGGDEYPASAIGINLPNADWIRARHGSKSVTIGNLTSVYSRVAKGNGFLDEFVIDDATRELVEKYGDVCDDLHTDLHECLGHGSGQLLPGTDADVLKAYGNTIEEARADLFGLYYMADKKLLELDLLDSPVAYQSQYYTYILNGLMTQLVRIKPGACIEEAHMRNRALIARWALEHSDGNIKIVQHAGKSFVQIRDYPALRLVFGDLLAEIQRIKSEGDYEAARELVEKYAVRIDPELHREVMARYEKLNIAPYKGFLNPWMKLCKNAKGEIKDVVLDYTETFEHQMLRYSKDYATL